MSDDAGKPGQAPPDAIRIERRRPTPLYRWLSKVLLRVEGWVRSHGSTNMRWTMGFGWALIIGIGALLLFGPVLNKPLGFDDIMGSARHAVDTWIARSFNAEYTLARDADGTLRVDVTERITAFFPDDVDESGLTRVIPSEYESHDLHPTLVSATLDGATATVTTDAAATRTTFGIDGGSRLRGDHDVVLRYTLRDLAYPAVNESTGRQEDLLEWNVFGPEFPHGVAASQLTVTVPRDLVDDYSRQPRGGIEWLLAGDSSQLHPDSETADAVTYRVANDQNMPPYTTFWFRMPFQAGTFTMPAPPFLYWVQLIGPFLPLLLLAVTLLFSLAARAVAWGDARGRAWYVYREEPPDGVSAPLSARLWRAVLVSPLVDALHTYRSSPSPATRRALIRSANRTGRLGNLLLAGTHYLQASAWREQFRRRYRRVPRGFVRDSFIGAALAWTVLQWGLVRQLSYQLPLSVYWWPVAIVAVTTILAVAILTITLSARPLTRTGALVKEQLLGMRLYVRQTSADERTTLRDPLLPFTVLFAPARRAGRLVRELIAREGLKAKEAAFDPDFVTTGRLAVRTVGVLAVMAAIAVAIWVPASTRLPDDDIIYQDELPGSYGFFVTDFSSEATLTTATGGRVNLEVQEDLTGTVTDGHRDVPQVLRQWHDVVDGHRMGLTVTSVTVDDAPVPFTLTRAQDQALLQTKMPDEWPGDHHVVITYTIDDPVAQVWQDGTWRQQLRWTALNPGWSSAWRGVDVAPERVTVGLTVPADLVKVEIGETGWLGGQGWPDPGVRDFGDATTATGGIHYHEEFTPDEYDLWPYIDTDDGSFSSADDPLGAQFQFAAGTFAAGARAPFIADAVVRAVPVALPVLFGMLALVAAVVAIWPRRGGKRSPIVRDAARWLAPGGTLAAIILFVWATLDLEGGEPAFLIPAGAAVLSLVATIWAIIATRSRKKPARTAHPGSR
ncbi:DUF2207 domain-containing protein [Microbacterium protaetiae]|uniref:DUF2207 domain-containing protein n=1 Tax=Microbacterium protaetiae TaxID=2509458 RepID=A0A4V0YDI7_9MICO|nr:DUF2207 domain-containing protein [Microbacterium protaetiae]QAY60851.1 DUF2207 domain-containing protein [Microbacterium protaetiae]